MPETWTLNDLVAEAKMRLEALPAPKNGQVRAVPDDRTVRYYATLGLLDRPAAMRGRTAVYGPRHLAQIVAIKRMQSAGHSLADIQQLWPTLDDATLMRISGVKIPTATAPIATTPAAVAPIATTPIAVAGKGGGRKDFWKREVETGAPPLAAPPRSAAPPLAPATTSPPQPATISPPAPPYRYPAPPASMPSSPYAPTSPIEIPAPPYAPFNPSVPLEIPPLPLQPYPSQPEPARPPVPLPQIPPPPEAPPEPPHAPVELRIEVAPGVAISIALPEDAPVSLSPAAIRALRAAAASLVTELANRGLTARAPGTMEEEP